MLWTLIAQAADSPNGGAEYQPGLMDYFWTFFYGGFSWIYLPFLIWMLFYCIRNDPDRYIWLWVILLFQPLGSIIYLFVRYLPSAQITLPAFTHRWTKTRELRQLETAALQIGNAHQHIQYGEALQKVGLREKALQSFREALKKDPEKLAALWGAASMEFYFEEYDQAKERLGNILSVDPTYKFGDVSLLYGKTLIKLDEKDSARVHLEKHIGKWRHPEALFLLAKLCEEQGEIETARGYFRGIIVDIDSSPKAIARKNLFWKSRARKAIRKLPADSKA